MTESGVVYMQNKEVAMMNALNESSYNRPYECNMCGGIMVFKGVGEYECEDCRYLDYDDYGKARNYIEKNPGATAGEISEGTGVSQKSIRRMLKESRLEIATNSRVFLKCDICGANIRHGSLCDKCEVTYHRSVEEQERAKRALAGYGMENRTLEEGAMRYINLE